MLRDERERRVRKLNKDSEERKKNFLNIYESKIEKPSSMSFGILLFE